MDNFPLMQPWTPPQNGDLNGDNQITLADAAIALQIAVGSREYDGAAYVTGDGQITSIDTLMIMQAAADAIEL